MPFLGPTHYLDHGQGRPLLLLHGMASRVEDWALQIPFFAQRFRVVAVDLRAHGRSVQPG
jgi:pimeloyl-ACP methyl ester carboxylesterase